LCVEDLANCRLRYRTAASEESRAINDIGDSSHQRDRDRGAPAPIENTRCVAIDTTRRRNLAELRSGSMVNVRSSLRNFVRPKRIGVASAVISTTM
jgi:hypothetical protein